MLRAPTPEAPRPGSGPERHAAGGRKADDLQIRAVKAPRATGISRASSMSAIPGVGSMASALRDAEKGVSPEKAAADMAAMLYGNAGGDGSGTGDAPAVERSSDKLKRRLSSAAVLERSVMAQGESKKRQAAHRQALREKVKTKISIMRTNIQAVMAVDQLRDYVRAVRLFKREKDEPLSEEDLRNLLLFLNTRSELKHSNFWHSLRHAEQHRLCEKSTFMRGPAETFAERTKRHFQFVVVIKGHVLTYDGDKPQEKHQGRAVGLTLKEPKDYDSVNEARVTVPEGSECIVFVHISPIPEPGKPREESWLDRLLPMLDSAGLRRLVRRLADHPEYVRHVHPGSQLVAQNVRSNRVYLILSGTAVMRLNATLPPNLEAIRSRTARTNMPRLDPSFPGVHDAKRPDTQGRDAAASSVQLRMPPGNGPQQQSNFQTKVRSMDLTTVGVGHMVGDIAALLSMPMPCGVYAASPMRVMVFTSHDLLQAVNSKAERRMLAQQARLQLELLQNRVQQLGRVAHFQMEDDDAAGGLTNRSAPGSRPSTGDRRPVQPRVSALLSASPSKTEHAAAHIGGGPGTGGCGGGDSDESDGEGGSGARSRRRRCRGSGLGIDPDPVRRIRQHMFTEEGQQLFSTELLPVPSSANRSHRLKFNHREATKKAMSTRTVDYVPTYTQKPEVQDVDDDEDEEEEEGQKADRQQKEQSEEQLDAERTKEILREYDMRWGTVDTAPTLYNHIAGQDSRHQTYETLKDTTRTELSNLVSSAVRGPSNLIEPIGANRTRDRGVVKVVPDLHTTRCMTALPSTLPRAVRSRQTLDECLMNR